VTVTSPMRSTTALAPLFFRRRFGDATDDQVGVSLGGRWLGDAAAALPTALLAPAGPAFDEWAGAAAVVHRQHGCVRYATDGTWLHGVAEIDDRADGLRAATRRAYADVFEVLADADQRCLLRLWNYLAEINRDGDGIERYRQFNAGRQQAFVDARRSPYEGAPAACALGVSGGPLRIYFLAGRVAPVAIENPRQVSAYHYPQCYGPSPPTFSRAALADIGGGSRALFISGTASIVGHRSMHPGDVVRQTEESLANLAAVREAAAARAGMPFAAEALTYTIYLRHATDLAPVRAVFESAIGAASPAAREAVYLQADVCRAELLVEIEAHGFAAAEEAA
jgi:chorismate lyase/3-hydroxybenzoate synthase